MIGEGEVGVGMGEEEVGVGMGEGEVGVGMGEGDDMEGREGKKGGEGVGDGRSLLNY